MSLRATPQEHCTVEQVLAIAVEEAEVRSPDDLTLAAVAEVRRCGGSMSRRLSIAAIAIAVLVGGFVWAPYLTAGIAGGQQGGDISYYAPDDGAITWDAEPGDGGNWSVELAAKYKGTQYKYVDFFVLEGDTPSPQTDPKIGGSLVNSPQWVNVTWDGADSNIPPTLHGNEWYIGVDDTNGYTVYGPFEFTIPAVELRNAETNNNVGNSDVEAAITTASGRSDTISAARISEQWQIPLTSFYSDLGPIDESVVIDITDDSGTYGDRTVTYNEPETGIAWLAATGEAVNVTFRLKDRSGAFPQETTSVELTKTIDGQQRQMVGDIFGATDTVTTQLVADDRYAIRVVNEDGDTREYGQYLANVENDLVELEVGQIGISPEEPDDYLFQAFETTVVGKKDGEHPAIKFRYLDGANATDSLEVVIHEHRNESNQLWSKTYTGADEVQRTIRLTENESEKNWVVNYNATRTIDGETQSEEGFVVVGGLSDVSLPVSSQALQAVSLGSILLLAGLFGGRLSQIGGIVVVGVAWVFHSIGWLSLPFEFLVAAAVVAVLFKVGTPDSGGIYS